MRGARTLNSASRSRSGVGRDVQAGQALEHAAAEFSTDDSHGFLSTNFPINKLSYLHQAIAPLPVVANERHGITQILFGRRMRNERGGLIPCDLEDIRIAQ